MTHQLLAHVLCCHIVYVSESMISYICFVIRYVWVREGGCCLDRTDNRKRVVSPPLYHCYLKGIYLELLFQYDCQTELLYLHSRTSSNMESRE